MDNDSDAERDENRIDGVIDADATGLVGTQAAIIQAEMENATNAEDDSA